MAGRLKTIDARTLADAVLEPPGYAVKYLLVQGLHILAGAPKTGKSWLALWLCQQVAGGEKVWGYPTQQGTVLYLCLEDGYHRLQDRLLDITEDPSENLYLATHAGTLADGLAGPFPVSWTVKMKKKQKETQDILSYHTQAAGCSDKARAKASGGRQPIEECGRTGL